MSIFTDERLSMLDVRLLISLYELGCLRICISTVTSIPLIKLRNNPKMFSLPCEIVSFYSCLSGFERIL